MYRIKEILKQKGISQKELAEKMGQSPQYINGIIRETGSASVTVLSSIANALDVPLSSLFDDYVSHNKSDELTALIHYKDEWYHAHTLEELNKIVSGLNVG